MFEFLSRLYAGVRPAAVLVGSLVLAAPASGGSVVPPLHRSLVEVRQAFLSMDKDRLGRLFPAEGRIFVALPPLGTDGLVGPGQLRALLGELASSIRTTSFTVVSPAAEDQAGPDWVYATACWRYRYLHTGGAAAFELSLALRPAPEDDRWVISEVKVIRQGCDLASTPR